MASGFNVDLRADLFQKVGTSPEMKDAIQSSVDAAAEIARRIAPVDTGDYRDGIDSVVYESRGGKRWVGRVQFNDPKSLLVESKTGTAYKALRAAKGAGL